MVEINKIDPKIIDTLTAIGNRKNLQILLFLQDAKDATYEQIFNNFKQHDDKDLKKRLYKLQNGNLVSNYYDRGYEESRYRVTVVFEKLISSTYEILYS